MEVELWEAPVKGITAVQPAADKSIGNQDRSASVRILPNPSKISELSKTTFTNFLHKFGESELRVKPHTKISNWLNWVKEVAKNIHRTTEKMALIDPSAFWYKNNQFCFISIQFKLVGVHPVFGIMQATI